MTNQLPPLPDDDSQFEETVQNQPQRNTRRGQRPPTQNPQQVTPRQQRPPTNYNIERVKRERRQRQAQSDNVFYFPLWSLGLMLLIVLGLAFVIVFLIVALGGRTTTTEADPIIRIITAEPSNTPDIPDPNEIVLATPTLPDGVQVILPAQTPLNQSLDGPLLPTIAFTQTPIPLAVGVTVYVADVGDQELNVRDVAGVTTSQVVFRAPEGTPFNIVDGPQQADGFTWWRIQDPITQNSGWAVANYLRVNPTGQ